jgi:hypothetical protein
MHAVPRVFISYAHDSAEHQNHVLRFANFLHARIGLDVRLDVWDDDVRRDWALWAETHLTDADYIMVIASPKFRRTAGSSVAPDDGRGSQYEAAIMRNELTRDLRGMTKRILPVVFPGMTPEDVPTFLNPYSTTRFHVNELSETGVADLVVAITGHGRHRRPARGQWVGETGCAPERPQVPVAKGLPWLTSSRDIRPGSAWIDGVRYDDSIVLRPRSVTAAGSSFVEVDLGGAYVRMTSVAGVLDDAAETFQVGQFRIYVDGHLRLESRVALGKSRTVDVDLAGATRLRLEMHRPDATVSAPFGGAAVPYRRSIRRPELAWGNPILF